VNLKWIDQLLRKRNKYMPKNLNFFAQNSWEKAVGFFLGNELLKILFIEIVITLKILKNDFKNERVIIESVIYQFRGLFE